MSESGTGEARRTRSISFPAMVLPESVEAIVIAGQNGADHSEEAFATYLGHRTSNSGAYRARVASLRDWGLITKRGERGRVTLTNLGQDFVMAAPEHTHDRKLILQAFESCRVFTQLYEDSAKNVAMDLSRLRSQVLMRMGVSADQVDKFIESFAISAAFAGLAEYEGGKITLLPRDAVVPPERDEEEDDPESQVRPTTAGPVAAPDPRPTPVAVPTEPAIPVALRQAWPINGGEIEFVIRTPKALPPEIYAVMAKMAAVGVEMAELLKPPKPFDFKLFPGAPSGSED